MPVLSSTSLHRIFSASSQCGSKMWIKNLWFKLQEFGIDLISTCYGGVKEGVGRGEGLWKVVELACRGSFTNGIREGIQKTKRWIFDRSHTYPGPPPLCLTALGFFFRGLFLNLLGFWLQSETDFVKITSNFDHENLNNSRTIKLHSKWYKTKQYG